MRPRKPRQPQPSPTEAYYRFLLSAGTILSLDGDAIVITPAAGAVVTEALRQSVTTRRAELVRHLKGLAK